MFGSELLDVIIALIFIFFVFALITTGLREALASLLKTRSKDLWREIERMLDGDATIATRLEELRALAGELLANPAKLDPEIDAAKAALETSFDKKAEATGGSKLTPARIKEHVDPLFTAIDQLTIEDVKTVGADAGPQPSSMEVKNRLKAKVANLNKTARGTRPRPNFFVYFYRQVFRSFRGDPRPVLKANPAFKSAQGLMADFDKTKDRLTQRLHDHPMVRQLDLSTPQGVQTRLSHVPSKDFAKSVVDLVQNAGGDTSAARAAIVNAVMADVTSVVGALSGNVKTQVQGLIDEAKGKLEENADEAIAGLKTALADVPLDENMRDKILACVTSARVDAEGLADKIGVANMSAALDKLSDVSPLKTHLEQALAQGVQTIDGMRSSVESWFDSHMNALSHAYRRWSKFAAFGLGLLVAVSFNVDAIKVSQELYTNEQVRSVVVAAAQSAEADELQSCVGAEDEENCAEEYVNDLIDTGLPIGWDFSVQCTPDGGTGECDWGDIGEWLTAAAGIADTNVVDWLWKVAGWLLAAVAFSMGAPFWYDLLGRAKKVKQSGSEKSS